MTGHRKPLREITQGLEAHIANDIVDQVRLRLLEALTTVRALKEGCRNEDETSLLESASLHARICMAELDAYDSDGISSDTGRFSNPATEARRKKETAAGKTLLFCYSAIDLSDIRTLLIVLAVLLLCVSKSLACVAGLLIRAMCANFELGRRGAIMECLMRWRFSQRVYKVCLFTTDFD